MDKLIEIEKENVIFYTQLSNVDHLREEKWLQITSNYSRETLRCIKFVNKVFKSIEFDDMTVLYRKINENSYDYESFKIEFESTKKHIPLFEPWALRELKKPIKKFKKSLREIIEDNFCDYDSSSKELRNILNSLYNPGKYIEDILNCISNLVTNGENNINIQVIFDKYSKRYVDALNNIIITIEERFNIRNFKKLKALFNDFVEWEFDCYSCNNRKNVLNNTKGMPFHKLMKYIENCLNDYMDIYGDDEKKYKYEDTSGESHAFREMLLKKQIEKKTLIELSFALNLDVNKSNELLLLFGYDKLHSRNLEEGLAIYYLNQNTSQNNDINQLFRMYFNYKFYIERFYKNYTISDNRGMEFSEAIVDTKEESGLFDKKIHLTANTRNLHIHQEDKNKSQSIKCLVDKIESSINDLGIFVRYTTRHMFDNITSNKISEAKLVALIEKEIDSFCKYRNQPLKELLKLIKESEYYKKEKNFTQLFNDIFDFYQIQSRYDETPEKNILLVSNKQKESKGVEGWKDIRGNQRRNFQKYILKTLLGSTRMSREAYICLILFFAYKNNSPIDLDTINVFLSKSQFGTIALNDISLNTCDIFIKHWLNVHEKYGFKNLRESLEYIVTNSNCKMIDVLDKYIKDKIILKYPLAWYS